MKLLDTLGRIFNRNSIGELKNITGSIDNSILTLANDVKLLDFEYIINQSTGEWLEEWGSWFGIYRLLNETDELYRNRIVAIVANPKSTIKAIEDSTKSYLGDPNAFVSVYEPFNDIFKFTSSTFSETHRYQDADYYRMGVIDIRVESDITDQLRDTLNQIKSGGVKIYFTRTIQLPMQYIKAPDDVSSNHEIEIMYDLVAWNTSDAPRYSDSSINQPMSGSQTSFYQDMTETTLEAYGGSEAVYENDLVETEFHVPFTDSVVESYEVATEFPMAYIDGDSSSMDTTRETNLDAVVARTILSGSLLVLNSFLTTTIEELSEYRDNEQQSVLSESLPV